MALMPSRISSKPETFYVRELNAAQRTRARCWATKPLGMLESMAFGREGGPLFLTFRSVIWMLRVMGIANRRKFWRVHSAARRKKDKYEEACLERRLETSPP